MACDQMQCADVNHFVGSRSGYKYISDGYIHSGTDIDICSEDDLCFFVFDHMRRLDIEQYSDVYTEFV